MPELTFTEIAGLTVGISALNITLIMAYINFLHKDTNHKLADLKECVMEKYNRGLEAHRRLWQAIGKKPNETIY